MNVYLWLVVVLLFQEPITATLAITFAYQNGMSMYEIHLIYMLCTITDIAVCLSLGVFIHRKYRSSRMGRIVERMIRPVQGFVHEPAGVLLATSLLVSFFPFSMVGVPWLSYAKKESLLMSLIGGAVLWYLPIWLVVLGVSWAGFSPQSTMMLTTLGTALLSLLVLRFKKATH